MPWDCSLTRRGVDRQTVSKHTFGDTGQHCYCLQKAAERTAIWGTWRDSSKLFRMHVVGNISAERNYTCTIRHTAAFVSERAWRSNHGARAWAQLQFKVEYRDHLVPQYLSQSFFCKDSFLGACLPACSHSSRAGEEYSGTKRVSEASSISASACRPASCPVLPRFATFHHCASKSFSSPSCP